MKRQNDLDKILKLISRKEKFGANVVKAIDLVIEWQGSFGGEEFETVVSDNFIVVTPVGAEFPISDSVFAVEFKTGEIKVDAFGHFGPVITGEQAANKLHTQKMMDRILDEEIKVGIC